MTHHTQRVAYVVVGGAQLADVIRRGRRGRAQRSRRTEPKRYRSLPAQRTPRRRGDWTYLVCRATCIRDRRRDESTATRHTTPVHASLHLCMHLTHLTRAHTPPPAQSGQETHKQESNSALLREGQCSAESTAGQRGSMPPPPATATRRPPRSLPSALLSSPPLLELYTVVPACPPRTNHPALPAPCRRIMPPASPPPPSHS